MTDLLITFFDIYDHALYISTEVLVHSLPFVWVESLVLLLDEFDTRIHLCPPLHWLFRALVIFFMALLSVPPVECLVQLLAGDTAALSITPGTVVYAGAAAVTVTACIACWEFAWDEVEDEADFYEEDFFAIWKAVVRLLLLGAICSLAMDHRPLLLLGWSIQPTYLPILAFVDISLLLGTWPWPWKDEARSRVTKALYYMFPILYRFPEDDEIDNEDGEEGWETVEEEEEAEHADHIDVGD